MRPDEAARSRAQRIGRERRGVSLNGLDVDWIEMAIDALMRPNSASPLARQEMVRRLRGLVDQWDDDVSDPLPKPMPAPAAAPAPVPPLVEEEHARPERMRRRFAQVGGRPGRATRML